MSSTDQPARSSGHLSGGWHEAPGADRPFTPQVETDVDPDVGFALTRAKWPWILALGCVAGLIWIFLAYGTPFGHTDPLESEAQQTQAVRASSITEFSSEQPTAPRIRRSGLVGPHLAQTPASPWLDELAMMVLTPPDEPLSQVAESLSPEWRVAVLSVKGVWVRSVAADPASASASAETQPRASWRLVHDPGPSLAERLRSCDDKGFFASARCRMQVCEEHGGDAPECAFNSPFRPEP